MSLLPTFLVGSGAYVGPSHVARSDGHVVYVDLLEEWGQVGGPMNILSTTNRPVNSSSAVGVGDPESVEAAWQD